MLAVGPLAHFQRLYDVVEHQLFFYDCFATVRHRGARGEFSEGKSSSSDLPSMQQLFRFSSISTAVSASGCSPSRSGERLKRCLPCGDRLLPRAQRVLLSSIWPNCYELGL